MKRLFASFVPLLLVLLSTPPFSFSLLNEIKPFPSLEYLTKNESWTIDLNSYFTGFHLTFSVDPGNSAISLTNSIESIANSTIQNATHCSKTQQLIFSKLEKGLVEGTIYSLASDNFICFGSLLSSEGVFGPVFTDSFQVMGPQTGKCENVFQIFEYLGVECSFQNSGNEEEVGVSWVSLKDKTVVSYLTDLENNSTEFVKGIPDHVFEFFKDSEKKRRVALLDPSAPDHFEVFEFAEVEKKPTLKEPQTVTNDSMGISQALRIKEMKRVGGLLALLDESIGLIAYDFSKGETVVFADVNGSTLANLASETTSSGLNFIWVSLESEEGINLLEFEITDFDVSSLTLVKNYTLLSFGEGEKKKKTEYQTKSVQRSSEFLVVTFDILTFKKPTASQVLILQRDSEAFGLQMAQVTLPGSQILNNYDPIHSFLTFLDTQTGQAFLYLVSLPSLTVSGLSESIVTSIVVESGERSSHSLKRIKTLSLTFINSDNSDIFGDIKTIQMQINYPNQATYSFANNLTGFVESVTSSEFNASILNTDSFDIGFDPLFPVPKEKRSESLQATFSQAIKYSQDGFLYLLQFESGTFEKTYFLGISDCSRNNSGAFECKEIFSLEIATPLTKVFQAGDLLVFFVEESRDSVFLLDTNTWEFEQVALPIDCIPQFIQNINEAEFLVCLSNVDVFLSRITLIDVPSIMAMDSSSVTYTSFDLPFLLDCKQLFLLDPFGFSYLIKDALSFLYFVSLEFIDYSTGKPLVLQKIETDFELIEGNYQIVTDNEFIYIQSTKQNAIFQMKLVFPPRLVLQKTLPLFSCDLVLGTSMQSFFEDQIHSLVSCNESDYYLVTHKPKKTFKKSLFDRQRLESGVTLDKKTILTSRAFDDSAVVILLDLQELKGKEPKCLIFGFEVPSELSIAIDPKGLSVPRTSVYSPSFLRKDDPSFTFHGMFGSLYTVSLEINVENYMNTIVVEEMNDLAEWNDQKSPWNNGTILQVNYSSLVKSHVSTTTGACFKIHSDDSKNYTDPCDPEVAGIFIPNRVDSTLFDFSDTIIDFPIDSALGFWDDGSIIRLTITLNVLEVDRFLQKPNPNSKMATSFTTLDFSGVAPESNRIKCLFIEKEKTDFLFYIGCNDQLNGGLYFAEVSFSRNFSNFSAPIINYYKNPLSFPPVHKMKAFGFGIIGLLVVKEEEEETAEHDSFVAFVQMDREHLETKEFLGIDAKMFDSEILRVVDFDGLPYAHTSKEISANKGGEWESFRAYLLVEFEDEDKTRLFTLEVENNGKRKGLSEIVLSFEGDSENKGNQLSRIQIKGGKVGEKSKTEELLLGGKLGESYLIQVSLFGLKAFGSKTKARLIGSKKRETILLAASSSFLIIGTNEGAGVYPESSSCDLFDLSTDKLSECVANSQDLGMIAQVPNRKTEKILEIIFIEETNRKECTQNMVISLYGKNQASRSRVRSIMICLSSSFSIYYQKRESQTWFLDFQNGISNSKTQLVLHKEKERSSLKAVLDLSATALFLLVLILIGKIIERNKWQVWEKI